LRDPAHRPHGFAGPRFFPATSPPMILLSPDELALPTVAWFKDSGRYEDDDLSVDFAKRITPNFSLEVGGTFYAAQAARRTHNRWLRQFRGRRQVSARRERDARDDLFVGVRCRPRPANRNEAYRAQEWVHAPLRPPSSSAKACGDLVRQDELALFAPLRSRVSIGVAIPTKARSADGDGGFEEHPDALELGLALEYSMP